MKRRFCISDIHGGYKALIQVFKESKIDYDNDLLICLGDCCDGWPEVKECFNEIMKFKNLVYIIGNHDEWARQYYIIGKEPAGWYIQGGKATIESFPKKMPVEILELISKAPAYYELDNMLFVHGGFNTSLPIRKQSRISLMWNRDLIYEAMYKQIMYEKHGHNNSISNIYDKIFIGHTPTLNFDNSILPIKKAEVYLIDTGASYTGPLTLVNIDTDEYWQSEPVCNYYPGLKARGHIR